VLDWHIMTPAYDFENMGGVIKNGRRLGTSANHTLMIYMLLLLHRLLRLLVLLHRLLHDSY